jgi:hypothetical protein
VWKKKTSTFNVKAVINLKYQNLRNITIIKDRLQLPFAAVLAIAKCNIAHKNKYH